MAGLQQDKGTLASQTSMLDVLFALQDVNQLSISRASSIIFSPNSSKIQPHCIEQIGSVPSKTNPEYQIITKATRAMASTSSNYAHAQSSRYGESSRSRAAQREQNHSAPAQHPQRAFHADSRGRQHPTGLEEHPPTPRHSPTAHHQQGTDHCQDARAQPTPRDRTKFPRQPPIHRKPVPAAPQDSSQTRHAYQDWHQHATNDSRSDARAKFAPHHQPRSHPQQDAHNGREHASTYKPMRPVHVPETPMLHSHSRPVMHAHSRRSAAIEGARHEARSKIEAAKQRAAEGATNLINAVKNAVEVAPYRVERGIRKVEKFIDELPEAMQKAGEDLRAFARAFPGKTAEELRRLQQTYRTVQRYAAQTPRAVRAAKTSFGETVRAPLAVDAAMMTEGLGRARSVRGA